MDVSFSELWESVMDREAWHAVIHGVAKSRKESDMTKQLHWTEYSIVYMYHNFFIHSSMDI